METNRTPKLTRRKPLSDCTNTSPSSSVPLNLTKPKSNPNPNPNPSSSSATATPNKPSTKCTSATNTAAKLFDALFNPSSPPPTTPSHGIVDLEASKPISIVYSRTRSSNKRKDKGKEVAVPVSSCTPILKVSNSREENDEVEGASIPKAKAFTVPCRKKRRAVSSEQDLFEDPQLQDFIEQQKAYFKMIDEYKLPEEEVESTDELD